MGRTKMNTRKLASNVKNICARRRETWKKSYKSFSKSTHSQDPESVYAGPKERDEACQWIHHQALSLQVAPDTMATAYALFDRALFSVKVKRSHVGVLAAACLSLSVKLLEDEICKSLGKYLIKKANLTFSMRDLIRMEMMLLQKFDWKMANEAANILRPKFKKPRIPRDFLSGEEDHEILPAISKLFSHGCLEPTPFGRHSFADIAAAAI